MLLGCVTAKVKNNTHEKSLDFKNCLLKRKPYNSILIEVPKKYKLNKVINNGFCEYRFIYKEGLIIYISSNIYNGSSLNYENLYKKGIISYSRGRKDDFKDTIKNSGLSIRSTYWLEYILGDVVVGYVNVPEDKKEVFDKAVSSIIRK